MPKKNPLRPFTRRKSAGNFLDSPGDEAVEEAPVSTFRVIDRSEKNNGGGTGYSSTGFLVSRSSQGRPPLFSARSAEELGPSTNRASGQTTGSYSSSSGHYESSNPSARHSSSSTMPSSDDSEAEPSDSKSASAQSKKAGMSKSSPLADGRSLPVPPPPSFSARAARAFSFAPRNSTKGATNTGRVSSVPSIPTLARREQSHSPSPRSRGLTVSSSASTAKPDIGIKLGSGDFGKEFSSMFNTTPRLPSTEHTRPTSPGQRGLHRTDSPPILPPRAFSRQDLQRSSPSQRSPIDEQESPYSVQGSDAYEALLRSMRRDSLPLEELPELPSHDSNSSLLSHKGNTSEPDFAASRGRGTNNNRRLNRSRSRNRWLKGIELHDPPTSSTVLSPFTSETESDTPIFAKSSISRYQTLQGGGHGSEDLDRVPSLWTPTTRITNQLDNGWNTHGKEDNMFEDSRRAAPTHAYRAEPAWPRVKRTVQKTMTKEEFEQLQQNGESGAEASEEEVEDEDEDEDEIDRSKCLAKQRQKQEANMSVYRQQMKKVTGGGPSSLPSASRPALDRSNYSAPNGSSLIPSIHLGGISDTPPATAIPAPQVDDGDDDDVPLGILQAHGFPTATRPPSRSAENDFMHQRNTSGTPSVVTGGTDGMPPFARNLPQDPYFGASVVNHVSRESLGMGGRASPIYGGGFATSSVPSLPTMSSSPALNHPSGLIGIIAGEERAKAARRGSPSQTFGTYGPPTSPSAMPYALGAVPGGALMPPGAPVYPHGMPFMPEMQFPSHAGLPMSMSTPQMPMMGNPEQMQHFVAMQMQVMQNMLTMQHHQMNGSAGQPSANQAQEYMAARSHLSNSPDGSTYSRVPTMTQRSNWNTNTSVPHPTSAMNNNSNYNNHGNTLSISGMVGDPRPRATYTPSIAPSERSNIGMPNRYRPVTSYGESGAEHSKTHQRTSSMTTATMTPRTAFEPHSSTTTPDPSPFLRPTSSGMQSRNASSTVRTSLSPSNKPVERIGATKTPPRIATHDPSPTSDKENEDDEAAAWAHMRKKRQDRQSKFKLNHSATASKVTVEPIVDELYRGLN